MSHKEQVAALERDLHALIDRYRSEFDLTLADAIGTLEVVKLAVWKSQIDQLEGK